MDSEQLGTWSQGLRNRVMEAGGIFVPTHVTTRVAVLVGGADVEFLDVNAWHQDDDRVGGTISVFTADLLAAVTFAGLQLMREVREGSPPEGDVTVSLVPRRTLARMTIDKGDGKRNHNGYWMRSKPRWPLTCQLRLVYPGIDDVIIGGPNLGFAEGSPIDDFLPNLRADLTARAS